MCLLSFLLLHNQLFYLENHALPNYSHLYMKYKQHLITSQLLMWEMYFLISQNPLIKSGMVVFYSNYKHMEVKVNFLPYLKLFWWSWIKNNTNCSNVWVEKNKLITPNILHIKPNIFRRQSDDSMCDFKCITFIECMTVGKTLSDYTNLFSLNACHRNDKTIYKQLKENARLNFRLKE